LEVLQHAQKGQSSIYSGGASWKFWAVRYGQKSI
jgi:hypothetical protein